jgi:hypothetical protein
LLRGKFEDVHVAIIRFGAPGKTGNALAAPASLMRTWPVRAKSGAR